MTDPFPLGSIVFLASGGPNMTVVANDRSGSVPCVICQWFSGNRLCDGIFPTVCLKTEAQMNDSGQTDHARPH